MALAGISIKQQSDISSGMAKHKLSIFLSTFSCSCSEIIADCKTHFSASVSSANSHAYFFTKFAPATTAASIQYPAQACPDGAASMAETLKARIAANAEFYPAQNLQLSNIYSQYSANNFKLLPTTNIIIRKINKIIPTYKNIGKYFMRLSTIIIKVGNRL